MKAPHRKVHLELDVNGERVEVAFEPEKTLLEVLREDLNLTGTKHGCELGECGACAVLLDGELVLSCLVAAVECEGRRVQTVEGMMRGPELHPLQAAFADHGAAQCGYCTPGFLLAALELLERHLDRLRAHEDVIDRERQPGGGRGVRDEERAHARREPEREARGDAGAQ